MGQLNSINLLTSSVDLNKLILHFYTSVSIFILQTLILFTYIDIILTINFFQIDSLLMTYC